MPIIKTKTSLGDKYPIEEEGPVGTFCATLVDFYCRFNVERPTFENRDVMERKDLVSALFQYVDNEGKKWFVQTFDMTMSASEKSKLYKMLKDLRGSPPPFDGESYDFCSEIGKPCQITVAKRTSQKGTTYLTVDGVSQILSEVAHKCPKVEDAEIPGGRKSDLPAADIEDQSEDSPF